MMMVINGVMSVIGMCHCGDVVGVVEPCSIWKGVFSLTIPRIESIRRLVDFDFTEMLWRDMIQDSEFIPFRDFSLGVQERRAQSKHGDQTIMIKGVQH